MGAVLSTPRTIFLLPKAALGTSKSNTVGGKVKIKIDAGTQSGKF